MLNQASDEMEAISFEDRQSVEVMSARLDLHAAAGHWDIVESFARTILKQDSNHVQAWVSLGCAVRRTTSVEAARDALLAAECALKEEHAIIHYNLACYYCLLGDHETAKMRLGLACRKDSSFKAAALDDPDLKPMWDHMAKET
ncbi:MAG: hypothetical protein NVV63_02345 [Opitutus sp.]|nr:hypothetical protein [Opitutus sp.]